MSQDQLYRASENRRIDEASEKTSRRAPLGGAPQPATRAGGAKSAKVSILARHAARAKGAACG